MGSQVDRLAGLIGLTPEATEEEKSLAALALSASEQDEITPVEHLMIALAMSPGGRPADDSPLGKPGGKQNWADKAGGLPKYIRMIAHALIRDHGFTTEHAIATARNRVRKLAATAKDPKVKAAAAAADAEWIAKTKGAH